MRRIIYIHTHTHTQFTEQWRCPPSFPRPQGMRRPGGVNGQGRRYMRGTRWTTRIEKQNGEPRPGGQRGDLKKKKIVSGLTSWKKAGFDHLLTVDKETQDTCWGFKIKGWWRKGDIRVVKTKKSFECWVKTTSDVPEGAQDSIKTALMAPQRNFVRHEFIVDLNGHEKQYWLGKESGHLGGLRVWGGMHSRRRLVRYLVKVHGSRLLQFPLTGMEHPGISSPKPSLGTTRGPRLAKWDKKKKD